MFNCLALLNFSSVGHEYVNEFSIWRLIRLGGHIGKNECGVQNNALQGITYVKKQAHQGNGDINYCS